MKYLLLFFVISTYIVTSHSFFFIYGVKTLQNGTDAHHLTVGARENGDKLIYQESIAEEYLFGSKRSINRTIGAPKGQYLTYIACHDRATDGTGAYPSILNGGPGYDWVEINFKSQRWHGIYFDLEVYGKLKY